MSGLISAAAQRLRAALAAVTGGGLVGYSSGETYAAGTIGAGLKAEEAARASAVSSLASTVATNASTAAAATSAVAAATSAVAQDLTDHETATATALAGKAALAGAAGQVFSVAAATAPEHAVRLGQSFAIAQTWQNVLSNRTLGQPYVNDTGRPIMLAITTHNTSGNDCELRVDVGGQRIFDEFIASPYVNSKITAMVVVPAGESYVANAVDTLTRWFELR